MAHHPPPTDPPHIPSDEEAKYYLYGLYSEARLIARSNSDIWMQPTGPEAYFEKKEFRPFGPHLLNDLWEDSIGPIIDAYLLENEVQCTILNPLRIAVADQPISLPVIMIGVNHDTLFPSFGLEIAMKCRSILVSYQIEDVHVIIYESRYHHHAALYEPAISADPAAQVCEPFSTTLGTPICNAKTTNFEGTGGFFFTDTSKPGVLHLLTARHVLFHPDRDENNLFEYRERSGDSQKKVMFMGEAAFKNRCDAIESAINDRKIIMEQLQRRWTAAGDLKKEKTIMERDQVDDLTKQAQKAIAAFRMLLADVTMDWKIEKNRVIGHVTLSPPLCFDCPDGGYTEDWVVIQIYPSLIAKFNCIGNAIDLGSIEVDKLTSWMYPNLENPSSFKYPGDRLLRFSGVISDMDMLKPDPKTRDYDNEPTIMVIKNGNTTDLTVGRLNTIRAFTRFYFDGQPGSMSKEIAVLSRNSKSGPFSARGDSGSVVVDGKGRVCGMITGGDGTTESSDCTFVTSINFILTRLAAHGIHANIFPTPDEL
ncbi:hypothetical protein MMC07_001582 [Pseudocyphellaria aurata]|nr:hypothetical protein [Pseudocyphellaria aurata]